MRSSEARGSRQHGISPCLPYESKSPRRYLRYWPLDIDIHNKRVAALRDNVHERWSRYLRTLPMRGLATADSAAMTERLWMRLAEELDHLIPPNASPTDDAGILMSWTQRGRHLEIEVMRDGSFEWFFRHRAANISEGGVQEPDTVPDELVARLRQVIF